ncbi:MAG: HAMP domain-containing histidine kinase [Sphaerochaetaceae bacterium]|nr:HAMP domain-containing histidine kinase [Sphaerochaetaceae bacterium]
MKLKVIEETQKSIKRRWKFIEGKERPLVYIGLSLAAIVAMTLLVLIYNNMIDKFQLLMKFESEKSFNSVYLALSDSNSKALAVMKDEGVSAIGIYSSNGQVYQHLGDAPDTLPISKLALARQRGDDSTLGIYAFDNDTKEIEYFRLSRLNVMLETGNLFARQSTFGASDFPEIIYVKFDGSSYFANIARTRFLTGIGLILMAILFLLILSIYNNNRRYRIALQKNESLAKLGAAARTLTHEIKNPLSAMTLQSALLKKLLPPEYVDDLSTIDSEIARLTSLTNRVSDFLKNPQGQPVDIELVPFITNIAKLFPSAIPVKAEGVGTIKVHFDDSRARSVFENLIKNATESCRDRDPEVSVEITKLRHRNVSIKILDRGDGLPKEAMDKLFDPFFTTKIHGSGIGLSIAKQFVDARGGTLKLYNRDGGGTVAEVILPYWS